MNVMLKSCATCSMHQLCLPMGLEEGDIVRLDGVIGDRRRVSTTKRCTTLATPCAICTRCDSAISRRPSKMHLAARRSPVSR